MKIDPVKNKKLAQDDYFKVVRGESIYQRSSMRLFGVKVDTFRVQMGVRLIERKKDKWIIMK